MSKTKWEGEKNNPTHVLLKRCAKLKNVTVQKRLGWRRMHVSTKNVMLQRGDVGNMNETKTTRVMCEREGGGDLGGWGEGELGRRVWGDHNTKSGRPSPKFHKQQKIVQQETRHNTKEVTVSSSNHFQQIHNISSSAKNAINHYNYLILKFTTDSVV